MCKLVACQSSSDFSCRLELLICRRRSPHATVSSRATRRVHNTCDAIFVLNAISFGTLRYPDVQMFDPCPTKIWQRVNGLPYANTCRRHSWLERSVASCTQRAIALQITRWRQFLLLVLVSQVAAVGMSCHKPCKVCDRRSSAYENKPRNQSEVVRIQAL